MTDNKTYIHWLHLLILTIEVTTARMLDCAQWLSLCGYKQHVFSVRFTPHGESSMHSKKTHANRFLGDTKWWTTLVLLATFFGLYFNIMLWYGFLSNTWHVFGTECVIFVLEKLAKKALNLALWKQNLSPILCLWCHITDLLKKNCAARFTDFTPFSVDHRWFKLSPSYTARYRFSLNSMYDLQLLQHLLLHANNVIACNNLMSKIILNQTS